MKSSKTIEKKNQHLKELRLYRIAQPERFTTKILPWEVSEEMFYVNKGGNQERAGYKKQNLTVQLAELQW